MGTAWLPAAATKATDGRAVAPPSAVVTKGRMAAPLSVTFTKGRGAGATAPGVPSWATGVAEALETARLPIAATELPQGQAVGGDWDAMAESEEMAGAACPGAAAWFTEVLGGWAVASALKSVDWASGYLGWSGGISSSSPYTRMIGL